MTNDFDVNRTASSVEPSVRPPWELEPSAKGAVFVVDLDGTLVRSDLLFQGVLTLLGRNPLNIVLILLWLWRGRAALKRAIARRVPLDPGLLPYNQDVLTFLRQQTQQGKKIVLATAADQLYAEAISAHLGVFSSIIASDSTRNLRGGVKADAIEDHLAAEPFVYIGNDLSDLPIFERATGAILVEPPGALKRKVEASGKLLGVFPRQSKQRVFFRAVRLHQWSKNLLVFLPAIAGHQILDLDNLLVLVVSFFALSLMASSVYIFNDALDLSADRRHPTKCQRPLASGALSLRAGAGLCALLFVGSLTVAAYLPAPVWLLLIAYVATSALYSFYLKRKRLVDILALVALYQLRLLIGHESAGIQYSYWFMMFFGFMFMSLAFLKRYNEIEIARRHQLTTIPGRAYLPSEGLPLAMLGVGCGMAAVIILTLYIHSDEVQRVYRNPYYLVAWCPIVLLSFARLWMLAQRAELDPDPVLSLIKDPRTYWLSAIGALVAYLAI